MYDRKLANAIPKETSESTGDAHGIPDTFPGCFGFWDFFKDECWMCAYNNMCKQQMNMVVV